MRKTSSMHSLEYIDRSEDGTVSYKTKDIVRIDVAHLRGIRHRGVWIHVLNSKNELLLVKRSKDTITCPCTWASIGEHTKIGETYRATALRGLEEELSLYRQDLDELLPLEQSPHLYNISYNKMRSDVQWTMSFLAKLKSNITSLSVPVARESGGESSTMLWMPVQLASKWIKSCTENDCRACVVETFILRDGSTDKTTSFADLLSSHYEMIYRKVTKKDEKSQ